MPHEIYSNMSRVVKNTALVQIEKDVVRFSLPGDPIEPLLASYWITDHTTLPDYYSDVLWTIAYDPNTDDSAYKFLSDSYTVFKFDFEACILIVSRRRPRKITQTHLTTFWQ